MLRFLSFNYSFNRWKNDIRIHHLTTILMYLFNKKERYELKESIRKNEIKYIIIVKINTTTKIINLLKIIK